MLEVARQDNNGVVMNNLVPLEMIDPRTVSSADKWNPVTKDHFCDPASNGSMVYAGHCVCATDASSQLPAGEGAHCYGNKAITKLLRTPGTLAGCAFLCTVVGHFVSFIGLTTLASLLAWITWMCFMALAFNLYCKYSGQFTEISEMIDEQAAVVHAHGQKEVMKFLVATYAPKQTGSKKTN